MYYKKTIDLHNHDESAAIPKILLALYDFDSNETIETVKFITGRGDVLRNLVIDFVEEQGF